ncbi:Exocyst complex component [Vespula maculifrons]|uniref:Exocyst complex component n=1 Tax=Vespula maculifrons TaxID=7453 RepID=A0ABD2CQ92_VESMC
MQRYDALIQEIEAIDDYLGPTFRISLHFYRKNAPTKTTPFTQMQDRTVHMRNEGVKTRPQVKG